MSDNEKNVGIITISGTVGIGKTALMAKIVEMMQHEFPGVEVVAEELKNEIPRDVLPKWERDLVINTRWVFFETIDAM